MREISTQIDIAAPPDRLWRILTDFPAMGFWNPFIPFISGQAVRGARLQVMVKPPGQRAMRFQPVLVEVDVARELRWVGRMGIPGLFDGEHSFRMERMGDHRTRFIHAERFSGLFVSLLMRGSLLEATRKGFEAMNEALKYRAEQEN